MVPTYASPSTDKCSNRTSILGASIPTLFKQVKVFNKREIIYTGNIINKNNHWGRKSLTYQSFPSPYEEIAHYPLQQSQVGSLSIAAHLSSSSSSSLPLFWNTSPWLTHTSWILAEAQFLLLADDKLLMLGDLVLSDLVDLARLWLPAKASAMV
jgi:hypothetical protein